LVKSELRDGIVWITIEGEVDTEEVKQELGGWAAQEDTFCGFITDLRGMTSIPSSEQQRELEEWRRQEGSRKPHALLGRTNALGVLVKMYISLTKAEDTRYFMNLEAAEAWVRGFGQQ